MLHSSFSKLTVKEDTEDVEPTFQTSGEEEDSSRLKREVRKHWDVSDHCSGLLFPTAYPELQLATPMSNYEYLLHASGGLPDQELVELARQAHYRVLAALCQAGLQVKNFVLPVQLMKMKYIDPYSRQRIVEELSRYLGTQTQLRSVVLEQATLSFTDLCRLLLSLHSSNVRRLYLWDALDPCHVPFKGPLQSDTVVDDCPRIPYTYNPGGRKYLRQLETTKHNGTSQGSSYVKKTESEVFKHEDILEVNRVLNMATDSYIYGELNKTDSRHFSDVGQKPIFHKAHSRESENVEWMDNLLRDSLINIDSIKAENYLTLLEMLSSSSINVNDHVHSQLDKGTQYDVGIQCNVFQERKRNTTSFCHNVTSQTKTLLAAYLTTLRIDVCKRYLKIHENNDIKIEILRDIYSIGLSGLAYLTTLSVNYSLIADGTGAALLSIGAVVQGRLRDLELLCQLADTPSPTHQQYEVDALHPVPDLTWRQVRQLCPRLSVHMVCTSMSPYDVNKQFITRSIPLRSLHIDHGFCPTLIKPQITFFSTLKCLYQNFKDTLEHINIVLWHVSGRIDSSLETFIKEATRLQSFEYYGPLQYKTTINKLCEAALLPSSRIVYFKLMVQGDPCYPQRARQLVNELYGQFLPRFKERSISFMLGTHGACP